MCSVLALLSFFSVQGIAMDTANEINQMTLRGRLQKTVEAGGWLVVDGGQKYLIINPQTFRNESWFKEGTEVEAVGETKSDVMTVYMEGTPFEVRSLRPFGQGGTAQNQVVAGDAKRLTRVMVGGDSIVHAQPDTAILTISVVTQAKRAIDAQQQNAAQSDAVVRTLKSAAGSGAESSAARASTRTANGSIPRIGRPGLRGDGANIPFTQVRGKAALCGLPYGSKIGRASCRERVSRCV